MHRLQGNVCYADSIATDMLPGLCIVLHSCYLPILLFQSSLLRDDSGLYVYKCVQACAPGAPLQAAAIPVCGLIPNLYRLPQMLLPRGDKNGWPPDDQEIFSIAARALSVFRLSMAAGYHLLRINSMGVHSSVHLHTMLRSGGHWGMHHTLLS